MKMYTVHDQAALAYLPPFCVPSERDARFQFENATNDPQTAINKSPSDYTLTQIAEFDQRTGELTLLPVPLIIGNAAAFLKPQ